MAGDRVVRDPIYDYVAIPSELDAVIDHPVFQRLRRVRQTSLALAVYPSATGSRFEHALGAMHLARTAFLSSWGRSTEAVRVSFVEAIADLKLGTSAKRDQLLRQAEIAVGAVALLHDVGHPPFSHALEPIIEGRIDEFGGPDIHPILEERGDLHPHEVVGLMLVGYRRRDGGVVLGPLLNEVAVKDQGMANLAAAVYSADEQDESCLSALHGLVAGPYDVDRLDYLARDNHRIGTEFGRIDHHRLVNSFELHEVADKRFMIAPGIRARSAVETLLSQRVQSYRWVIFHSRIVGTNVALARAVELGLQLCVSTDAEVSQCFERIRPNLNYLNPRDEDIERSTGGGLPAPEVVEKTDQLFSSVGAEARMRMRVLAQAGVDDDTVTTFLKQGAQLAEALLVGEGSRGAPLQRDLRRFIAYVRSALFREKRFVAVWKTNDEYIDVAADLVEPLLEAVREATLELDTDEARAAAETVEMEFQRGVVDGLNHVVRAVVSAPADVRALEQHLNASATTVLDQGPGWWTLQYAPLRAVGRSLTLFSGDSEIDLVQRSPFVRALRDVDATSTMLFAHFFVESQTFSQWGDKLQAARRELQQRFVDLFPGYVRMAWPLYLHTPGGDA